MFRKSFAIFVFVVMLSLAFTAPAGAMQTSESGQGDDTTHPITYQPLSDNRAALTIWFDQDITGNVTIRVNGHEYQCEQIASNALYCVGYLDRSWKAIEVAGYSFAGEATNLVLDVNVPIPDLDGDTEGTNDVEKTDDLCISEPTGGEEDCSSDPEPTFCELNPSDPSCSPEPEPTFCELNPSDPSCSPEPEPTFCELNPTDPSCLPV
jgi:hypothetical protein